MANIPDLTSEVKVKPCLFQSGNRCRAKKNSFKLYEMCMCTCFEKLLLAACITNQLPQGCPAFFFIVPVRSAICSVSWNRNKQGFTVCPHLVSARREHILLIAQVFDDKNYWWEHFLFILASYFILWNKVLVSPKQYHWYYLQYMYLFGTSLPDACCASFNIIRSWASTWVHLNCYAPLYSHWWVMMVQFGEIEFGVTHFVAASRQLH